jgi:hypothetical protein
MSYLFNFFLTKKNLSSSDLEDTSNIFQFFSSKSTSLLEKYKDEINNYIENNKIDLKNFHKNKNFHLKKLSNIYDNIFIKENKIKLFFYYLIDSNIMLNNNITNINSFIELFNKFDKKSISTYSKSEIFYNPFGYFSPFSSNINISLRNFNNEFINIKDFSKINKSYNNNNIINNLQISLDILTQSKIINISLPSIGIIKNNFSNKNNYSYITFIDKLLKIKNEEDNISEFIPLKSLDLGSIISDMLFDINNDEFNLIKKNFKNTINNINITLDEIFFDTVSKKNNKKKQKKIKTEFIIPYKLDSSKKNEIISSSKNDIDRIKNIKELIEKNNFIISFVLKKIHQSNNNNKILEKTNFKNILSCFMFYIINLVYTISKIYIDKIDYFLFDIISSKDKRYSNLNIKKAFEYTNLLKKSLYKFKLILLNSFYYLFTPLNFLSGNYGMKLNDLGCYIPDGTILKTNLDLLNEFPFYSSNNSDNSTTYINLYNDKLSNFLLNSKNNYDIYDNKNILEIGGYSFDFYTLKKSLSILNEYYKYTEKYNKFNLFIVKLLIKNFMEKNIPIELIDKLDSSLYFIKSNKNEFERKLLLKYDNNMDKAVSFILNVLSIRQKIKNSKKNNVENLNYLETINLCCYNIYYLKSQSIINMIKNLNLNINFKNILLEKLLKKKKEYEDLIKKNK